MTHTKRELTHIAKKDRRCNSCGATIPTGAKYRQRRERAVSCREACHAGRYPIRRQCEACVEKWNQEER